MPRQRKQSPIITILIVLLGLMAGYLVHSSSSGDEVSLLVGDETRSGSSILGSALSKQDITRFNDIVFDLSIIDDPSFKSLRIIGDSVIDSDTSGRTNIFAPF
ncbi:MAG: hypothetical protein ABH833_02190 [Parcubacteria group bacterium]